MRAITDILVADDSDHDAELTLYAVRQAAPNVSILRVRDGEQALQFLFATGGYAGRAPGLPRLVLLDLWMPTTDGLAALKVLRGQAATREMPVVLLSSCSNPLVIERARALGANEYVIKPAALDAYCTEVAGIVTRWCGVRPPAAATDRVGGVIGV